MAKRLTDSNKYANPFIRSLPSRYKLLWDYIMCACDHAGVWNVDWEIAQLYIGKDAQVDQAEALTYFNRDKERVILVDEGQRWFIPSFVTFQYGPLNPANRVHSSVLSAVERFMGREWAYTTFVAQKRALSQGGVVAGPSFNETRGGEVVVPLKSLPVNWRKANPAFIAERPSEALTKPLEKEAPSKPLPSPKQGCKDKDKDKDKDMDKDKDLIEGNISLIKKNSGKKNSENPSSGSPKPRGAKIAPVVDGGPGGGGKNDSEAILSVSVNSATKGQKNPPKKNLAAEKTLKHLIPESWPFEEFMPRWESYVELRKAKRRPLTDHAVNLRIAQLVKVASGEWEKAKSSMDRTIARGYDEFYPDTSAEVRRLKDAGTSKGFGKL